MKQFVVKRAYTDNYHVLFYNNGKFEGHNIVPFYELDDYITVLEGRGYERAYYEKEYRIIMQRAKEEYEFAFENYKKTKENPLILSEKEVKRYEQITHTEN